MLTSVVRYVQCLSTLKRTGSHPNGNPDHSLPDRPRRPDRAQCVRRAHLSGVPVMMAPQIDATLLLLAGLGLLFACLAIFGRAWGLA